MISALVRHAGEREGIKGPLGVSLFVEGVAESARFFQARERKENREESERRVRFRPSTWGPKVRAHWARPSSQSSVLTAFVPLGIDDRHAGHEFGAASNGAFTKAFAFSFLRILYCFFPFCLFVCPRE